MNKLLLTAGLLFLATFSYAQSPSTGGPTPGPAAANVPLDGGSSLLLASGVAYGLRRLKQRRAARKAS